MDLPAALALAAALVVASALAGLLVGRRRARVRPGDGDAPAVDLEALGIVPSRVPVIVQFSTAYCTRCPATARMLSSVAAETGAVHHEIDVTERPDLVRGFALTSTPTVLVVDTAGSVAARVSGVPGRRDVVAAVDALSPSAARRPSSSPSDRTSP